MAESDEGALIDRALGGDAGAFGELVRAHERVVYNLVLRMVGNAEDARDLAQNAFVKAWEKLGTFDRRSRFFSWIYRIALNEALNHRSRRRIFSELDAATPSEAPGPEERYDREHESASVRAALMEMEHKDRELLVMRHFLQFSHHEMSEVLQVPEKTVKSRLHTARTRF